MKRCHPNFVPYHPSTSADKRCFTSPAANFTLFLWAWFPSNYRHTPGHAMTVQIKCHLNSGIWHNCSSVVSALAGGFCCSQAVTFPTATVWFVNICVSFFIFTAQPLNTAWIKWYIMHGVYQQENCHPFEPWGPFAVFHLLGLPFIVLALISINNSDRGSCWDF